MNKADQLRKEIEKLESSIKKANEVISKLEDQIKDASEKTLEDIRKSLESAHTATLQGLAFYEKAFKKLQDELSALEE